MKTVFAICSGDWHCWLEPPAARANEPDWPGALVRPIREISDIQDKYTCPVLIAGDLFHRYNPPPELLWRVLSVFPSYHGRFATYAVPGQHDLRLHNLKDICHTAYGLLANLGKIEDLSVWNRQASLPGGFDLFGFGWGQEITPPGGNSRLKVCLIHKYLWTGKNDGFPGAPEDGLVHNIEALSGYDVVISGDNHNSFYKRIQNGSGRIQTFYNPGSLHRRNSDQIGHHPQVGLLHEDGSITTYFLNISKDVFTPTETPSETPVSAELESFIRELQHLKTQTLDFGSALERAIEKLRPNDAVTKIIREAVSDGK